MGPPEASPEPMIEYLCCSGQLPTTINLLLSKFSSFDVVVAGLKNGRSNNVCVVTAFSQDKQDI